MVGHYFHTWQTEPCGCRLLYKQGHIVGKPDPGVYLVEWFSFMTGAPNGRTLVRVEQVLRDDWTFYPTVEGMHAAYDDYNHLGIFDRHYRAHGVEVP